MEMTYEGALVMPMGCALMDEEEMTYVDGGMSGRTKTAEDRICTASFIAAASLFIGDLSASAFATLLGTAATGVGAVLSGLGGSSLFIAAAYESKLAGKAAAYATKGKNYSYTYYGFGSVSFYTSISA